MESVSRGKIAKNTLLLYFRMLFVMGVTLYTSRVILEVLGIDDFGIYQTVGGIVGMLTFVNSALSTGTSRFITFELGKNDKERLKRTFSTTVTMQLFLAIIIVTIAETIGVWFVKNKLQIDAEVMPAALWAYHLSILTTVFNLISVPFVASIISHERMGIFAYLGIFDACAKLGIVYLLTIGDLNRLVFYAFLLLMVQVIVTVFYVVYCVRHFSETRYQLMFDRKIFGDIAGFSGWSLFATSSIALNNQGVLILLNMFFSPAVVTARAISLQVNNAANQFVSNFRTAVNPQIIKQYAAGNYDESKSLLLSSTKYSFYMMLILGLPICLGARSLLEVWLKEVPDYTVIFLQLVIIQSLFQVFDTSFYTALYAKGDLKANALISPTLGFLMFPIVYILFKTGASPIALSWASLIMYALLGLVVKPILLIRIVDYRWKEIWSVFRPCLWVTIIAGACSVLVSSSVDTSGMTGLIITTCISLGITMPTIYFLGLNKAMREKIKNMIFSKFKLHVGIKQ